MQDIIYFEFNNWFAGRDYPMGEKYNTLVNNAFFNRNEWVKENKLVVVVEYIDMSLNWCISAPKEWVEENLPELLSDKEYTYKICTYSKGENTINEYSKKYNSFLRNSEDIYFLPEGRFGTPFLEYCEENIGVHWHEHEYEYEDEYDED